MNVGECGALLMREMTVPIIDKLLFESALPVNF